jgi:YHS domain-containing protein/regulation of enolase protein 1 (concanavalin A-like superfamily)
MRTSLLKTLLAAGALCCALAQPSQAGWIKRYIYDNYPGVTVADLYTTNTLGEQAFPDFPNSVQLIPPDTTFSAQLVESAVNVAENFGSYLPGYIEPPETGNYTFWICGDDEAQFWLTSSPTDPLNPALKQLICSVPGWSNAREYNKYPEQQSAPVYLEQGKRYYLEILHKEGTSGDNVGIGWQRPGGQLERPMPSYYLQPVKEDADPVPVNGPYAAPIVPRYEYDFTLYDGMEVMLFANLNLTPPYTVSWRKNGVVVPGADQTYYRFRVHNSDNGALFYITVNGVDYGPLTLSVYGDATAPELVSATVVPNNPTQIQLLFSEEISTTTATNLARYSLNTATVLSAELQADGRSVLLRNTLLDANQVNTLTINGIQDWALPANTMATTSTNLLIVDRSISYRYWNKVLSTDLGSLRIWSSNNVPAPSYVTNGFNEERTITTTSYPWSLVPARDNYMAQMIGYIIPPETGMYRFAVASDDHSILYLGTDDQASSKREIACYNGSTGQWNSGAQLANQQSVLIYLQAGKRYYFEAVTRDGTGGDGVSVFWQTPSGPPIPTANASVQANTQPFLIPTNYLATYTSPSELGGLTFRIWNTPAATDLATLRVWSGSPDMANDLYTEERAITSSSYAWNLVPVRNNFPAQMIGYLTPPETGNYKFAIASDDQSILYLGTDHLRSSKREVCNASASTGRWNVGLQLTNQQSALIFLEAGKRYYFEAVNRDGTGGDGVSIFWQTPSGLPLPTANENVQANTEPFLVPAAYLSQYSTYGNVFFKRDLPASVVVAASTQPALTVAADGSKPYSYQWLKSGTPIVGATRSSYTLPFVQGADDGATYAVAVSNLFSSATSTVATLSVTADTVKPYAVSVGSLYKQTVEVRLSEPVTPASATTTGNYLLLSATGAVVAVTSAVQDPADASRITLQTAPLPETELMRLVTQNLVDASPAAHVMNPQTNLFRANNFDTLVRIGNTQPYAASAVGDQLFMTAGGADIYGNADQCAFLYKTVTGNFDYRVKGVYIPSVNNWTKMGPMARASEAAGARNAISCFTPATIFQDVGQNQYSPQIRDTTGGASTSSDAGPLNLGLQPGQAQRPTITIPSWLRLQRVGNTIYYHRSLDGTNWTYWTFYDSAASVEGPLPATLQVGVALTSHDTTYTADAVVASFSAVNDGPLAFTLTPTNVTVVEGGTATFACTVTGNSPWFYSWTSNGIPVLGATSNVLVLTQIPFSASGATLAVTVTNLSGQSITASALLFVQEPDFTKPTIARVGSVFKGVVELFLSEGITGTTANNLANYTLRDSNGALVDIYWVQQEFENPSHITLNTAPMPETDLMQLAVGGLQDLSVAGNIMNLQTNRFRANNFDTLERIGNTQAYSASANGEQISMTAGGADIWGTADQCAWLYKTVSGDFDYKIQGVSLPAVNQWCKMGIMARVSSAANARNNLTCFTPLTPGQNTYSPQVRQQAGAATSSSDTAADPLGVGLQPGQVARPAVSYPSWLRLQRVGDTLFYYYGTDGTNWTYWTRCDTTTSPEGPMPTDLQLGLALTSHDTALTVDGVMATFTTVNEGPLRFALEPVSVTVEEGGTAVFTARAEGRSPYLYQWSKNGGDIAGATTTALTLTGIPISDNGSLFACRIANPFGDSLTSSNAVLTVVQDTNKPVAYAVGSLYGTGVGVYFSDLNRLDPISAGNPLNYTVNGGTVTVTSATVEPDNLAVMLTLSAPISGAFTVGIQNVTDGAPIPNPVAPVTLGSSVVTWPGSQDIGTFSGTPPVFTDPLLPGFAQAIGTNGFYVHASGSDIWNNVDGMHFVHAPVTGDFDVAVRVAGLLRPNEWSKAGLMVREELTADSRNYMIATAPTSGQNLITVQWRLDKGGASASIADAARPRPSPIPNAWLRMARVGQEFTFYYGTNGASWTALSTNSQAASPYPATVYVGMATTSHSNAEGITNITSAYYLDLSGLRPPPSLTVAVVGANVAISWTASSPAYQLTASPQLSPANWQPVGTAPVISGETYTVTIPVTGTQRFFRLVRP